jgi:hypothetical protein
MSRRLRPERFADLATTQPSIFVAEETYSFWGGGLGTPAESRDRFYRSLGKSPAAVFPITFCARPGVAPAVSGTVPGFLRSSETQIVVET